MYTRKIGLQRPLKKAKNVYLHNLQDAGFTGFDKSIVNYFSALAAFRVVDRGVIVVVFKSFLSELLLIRLPHSSLSLRCRKNDVV